MLQEFVMISPGQTKLSGLSGKKICLFCTAFTIGYLFVILPSDWRLRNLRIKNHGNDSSTFLENVWLTFIEK